MEEELRSAADAIDAILGQLPDESARMSVVLHVLKTSAFMLAVSRVGLGSPLLKAYMIHVFEAAGSQIRRYIEGGQLEKDIVKTRLENGVQETRYSCGEPGCDLCGAIGDVLGALESKLADPGTVQ